MQSGMAGGPRWRARAGKIGWSAALAGAASLALAACSSKSDFAPLRSPFARASPPDLGVSPPRRILPETAVSIPKGGGSYKLGSPYQIAGVWYTPREEPRYDRVGIASWYGIEGHGRETANGEIFDMRALTAAHPTLPIPSYGYVSNLANGRTILVRINDRGPYANDRILDVSREAARLLGFTVQGMARVRVVYAGRAPMNGDDSAERRFLMAQAWYRVQNQAVASASPAVPRSWSTQPAASVRTYNPSPVAAQAQRPQPAWMKPLPWEQAGNLPPPSGLGGN